MKSLSACALALLLTLPACTTPGTSTPLATRLGKPVELAGRFGEAKLGPFVAIDDDLVFLREPALSPGGIDDGARVLVSGRLEHDAGSGDYDCDPGEECVAAVPAHWFIRGARVRVAVEENH